MGVNAEHITDWAMARWQIQARTYRGRGTTYIHRFEQKVPGTMGMRVKENKRNERKQLLLAAVTE